ncbi:MAG: glycerol kinase GlpK [Clostridia bacterium]|nr:glycerol kinase GlpK [Clostridia bacterium]
MKQYLLALDEGTTSARAILIDRTGRIVSVAQHEFTQIYPRPGWVEHDAMEIYASQYAAMTECIAGSGVPASEIAAIGVTNQRETTVVWEKATGRPIANAIVWQCRRTADICEKLIADGFAPMIEEKTGLRPDAYFSGTKIAWLLDNVPGAREKAEAGELLFGTVDTWLLWKLTDGRVHVTDRTNASRTMLYNIGTCEWDDELLRLLGVPRSMLPEVRSSSEIYAEISVMGQTIPVSGIAGDQQAALFGQCCFDAGDIKTTYGTGCFLLANTGAEKVKSRHGLLTTMAATEAGRAPQYVLEGSVFVGGAVIQWLRDEMRFIAESRDSEYFAGKVPDAGGVYVVPAFAGLGAPYWDMNARGTITGITRGTRREHIVRAALESIAYQTEDLIDAMEKDLGRELSGLRVDGGAAANGLLMQFQADISNLAVFRPDMREATALGAAYLAGLGCGFYKGRDELKALPKPGVHFTPEMDEGRRGDLLDGWHRAVRACTAK